MVATEGLARRLWPAFINVLLVAVVAVVLARAAVLYREADVLTAHSERRWAYITPGLLLDVPFAQAAPLLRDGEAVCLKSPIPLAPTWLRVRGNYFFTHQIVIVQGEASKGTSPVCRRVVLLARPSRSSVLWRRPDADPRR